MFRPSKKNYMVLVRARTTFAYRTTNFFYFSIQHFLLCFCFRKQYRCVKGKKNQIPAYLIILKRGEGDVASNNHIQTLARTHSHWVNNQENLTLQSVVYAFSQQLPNNRNNRENCFLSPHWIVSTLLRGGFYYLLAQLDQ